MKLKPSEMLSFLLVIPSYNGRECLERLLNSLPHGCPVYVIDSSSSDGTQELLGSRDIDYNVIPKQDFNHGATRQRAIQERPGYDFYIYLTQDAFLSEPKAIDKLLAYFDEPGVGAVCGRQLPHFNANPLSVHARRFNYPERSEVKSHQDIHRLGLKTAFMSNSFAAYRADALAEVDGFPDDVILAEDMYVAARMLQNGWKVAYAGDACCHHSHNYTVGEEFRRYFDIGVFHACEPWIQQELGGAGGEGRRFLLSEWRHLGFRHLAWWPTALMATAMKLAGYKLGKQYANLPGRLCRAFSMHKGFWGR